MEGMLWVQYFARNQYTNEGDTYNPDASMRNNNWEGFYTESLINFQKVIEITGMWKMSFIILIFSLRQ